MLCFFLNYGTFNILRGVEFARSPRVQSKDIGVRLTGDCLWLCECVHDCLSLYDGPATPWRFPTFLSALAQSVASVRLRGGWYWCQRVRVTGEPSDHSTVGNDAGFRRPIHTSGPPPETEKHRDTHTKGNLHQYIVLIYIPKVSNRKSCISICGMLLTVSQQLQQHLHLRQRVEAGEVSALGATGPGRFLPASSLWLWQDSVAEAVMRPPAIRTLRMDVLPILCERRKNQERRRNQKSTDQNNNTHSQQTLFWSRRVRSSPPRCRAAVQPTSNKS